MEEEKKTMDDFAEELEASYKAAEEAAPKADDEADPVWAELKQQMDDKTVLAEQKSTRSRHHSRS